MKKIYFSLLIGILFLGGCQETKRVYKKVQKQEKSSYFYQITIEKNYIITVQELQVKKEQIETLFFFAGKEWGRHLFENGKIVSELRYQKGFPKRSLFVNCLLSQKRGIERNFLVFLIFMVMTPNSLLSHLQDTLF